MLHRSSGLAGMESSSPEVHKDEAFLFLFTITVSLAIHLFSKTSRVSHGTAFFHGNRVLSVPGLSCAVEQVLFSLLENQYMIFCEASL